MSRGMFGAHSQSLSACSPSLPTGEPLSKPCLDFQPRLRLLRLGERTHEAHRDMACLSSLLTCGVWRRCNGPMQLLVHILFQLQRDDHWEAEQALLFCYDVRTSTHVIQSIGTKAFGREGRTQPRNRLKSQTPHVLHDPKFHVGLTRHECQKH